ncbi:F0F1 ATP synthase subunit A [Gryllotalpicola ginsengisoli]|uniref:F0F1 ATP synthase subunit A n=1 Tax=Gryllotalpicola ginsengisoli TaxID=444608 RepID=UPI0003B2F820|nr:F0F1 ATP synthase subunit A [Gryllotalpicola ginsengisoli]
MNLLVPAAANDGQTFQGPTIEEFFPQAVLFEGTPFELNRVMLIRILATIALIVLMWIGTRAMKVVPGRFQSVVEMGLDFIRVGVVEDLLGKKDGRRFLPLIAAIFFFVLFMNITGVVPLLNLAGSSVIGVPLVLAVIAYIAFIYAGVRKSPKLFFKNALLPAGVPPVLYIIVTPIEFISTFIIRPVTLTLRLLMNMIVGHLLLVLFFSATTFFFLYAPAAFKAFGLGTLAFGFAFQLFEVLVALLQAYVFAILTTVYIQLAVAEEH